MENLTTLNILLLLLGFTLQVLVTLKNAIKEKTFSFRYWIFDNLIEVPISLICAFVGVIMAKDMIELFGVKAQDGSPFYMIHAFLCGYMGRELIFRVLDWFKKK